LSMFEHRITTSEIKFIKAPTTGNPTTGTPTACWDQYFWTHLWLLEWPLAVVARRSIKAQHSPTGRSTVESTHKERWNWQLVYMAMDQYL
jgi:hypothetical protein